MIDVSATAVVNSCTPETVLRLFCFLDPACRGGENEIFGFYSLVAGSRIQRSDERVVLGLWWQSGLTLHDDKKDETWSCLETVGLYQVDLPDLLTGLNDTTSKAVSLIKQKSGIIFR